MAVKRTRRLLLVLSDKPSWAASFALFATRGRIQVRHFSRVGPAPGAGAVLTSSAKTAIVKFVQVKYALRERALALGWPAASVVVVDEDTGRSGASTHGREGFKELVADALGSVGLILALEVSRFARSSADWHQLIDVCALTGTLIADSDGIYAPGDFNDRLLLGLKGTMSEAELHLIRARLDVGLRNKAARRGAGVAPAGRV